MEAKIATKLFFLFIDVRAGGEGEGVGGGIVVALSLAPSATNDCITLQILLLSTFYFLSFLVFRRCKLIPATLPG